jgi:hypothetical protein
MVAAVDVATVLVVTVKVALVAPCMTVTLAGTVATAVLLLERVTLVAAATADVNVTLPVEGLPPTTDEGFTLTADKLAASGAACGVKLRTLDHAPAVPAEFTPRTRHQCWRMASEATESCDTVSVCSTTRGAENVLESSIWIRYDAAPLTSAQSSRIGSATVAPFAGLTSAGAAGVEGDDGGVTLSVAVRVAPEVPEIVTSVEVVTADVVTVKVPLVLPAPTVTLAGTAATAVLLLESDTTVPPDGAALVSVTVP